MAVIGAVILCEQECQDMSKPMSVKDCVWIFFRVCVCVCVWQYSCMLLALGAVLGEPSQSSGRGQNVHFPLIPHLSLIQ